MKCLCILVLAFQSVTFLAQGTSEEYPVDSASLAQPGYLRVKF